MLISRSNSRPLSAQLPRVWLLGNRPSRATGAQAFLLDRFIKSVARAERGDLLSRYIHLLPCLRVPALPHRTLLGVELAETRDLNLLAALKGRGDYVLDRIEVALGLAYGSVGLFGYPLDELLLVTNVLLYLPPLGVRRAGPRLASSTCLDQETGNSVTARSKTLYRHERRYGNPGGLLLPVFTVLPSGGLLGNSSLISALFKRGFP